MTNISLLKPILNFECQASAAFEDRKAGDALRFVLRSYVGAKRAAHFYIGQVLRADAG